MASKGAKKQTHRHRSRRKTKCPNGCGASVIYMAAHLARCPAKRLTETPKYMTAEESEGGVTLAMRLRYLLLELRALPDIVGIIGRVPKTAAAIDDILHAGLMSRSRASVEFSVEAFLRLMRIDSVKQQAAMHCWRSGVEALVYHAYLDARRDAGDKKQAGPMGPLDAGTLGAMLSPVFAAAQAQVAARPDPPPPRG